MLSFVCKECGSRVNKLDSFRDVFSIKRGKVIECKQCSTRYAVPRFIQKIGSVYHYIFVGGGFAIVWLFLTIVIDNLVGDTIANKIGLLMWGVSAIAYIVIEIVIALVLPLNIIKKEE